MATGGGNPGHTDSDEDLSETYKNDLNDDSSSSSSSDEKQKSIWNVLKFWHTPSEKKTDSKKKENKDKERDKDETIKLEVKVSPIPLELDKQPPETEEEFAESREYLYMQEAHDQTETLETAEDKVNEDYDIKTDGDLPETGQTEEDQRRVSGENQDHVDKNSVDSAETASSADFDEQHEEIEEEVEPTKDLESKSDDEPVECLSVAEKIKRFQGTARENSGNERDSSPPRKRIESNYVGGDSFVVLPSTSPEHPDEDKDENTFTFSKYILGDIDVSPASTDPAGMEEPVNEGDTSVLAYESIDSSVELVKKESTYSTLDDDVESQRGEDIPQDSADDENKDVEEGTEGTDDEDDTEMSDGHDGEDLNTEVMDTEEDITVCAEEPSATDSLCDHTGEELAAESVAGVNNTDEAKKPESSITENTIIVEKVKIIDESDKSLEEEIGLKPVKGDELGEEEVDINLVDIENQKQSTEVQQLTKPNEDVQIRRNVPEPVSVTTVPRSNQRSDVYENVAIKTARDSPPPLPPKCIPPSIESTPPPVPPRPTSMFSMGHSMQSTLTMGHSMQPAPTIGHSMQPTPTIFENFPSADTMPSPREESAQTTGQQPGGPWTQQQSRPWTQWMPQQQPWPQQQQPWMQQSQQLSPEQWQYMQWYYMTFGFMPPSMQYVPYQQAQSPTQLQSRPVADTPDVQAQRTEEPFFETTFTTTHVTGQESAQKTSHNIDIPTPPKPQPRKSRMNSNSPPSANKGQMPKPSPRTGKKSHSGDRSSSGASKVTKNATEEIVDTAKPVKEPAKRKTPRTGKAKKGRERTPGKDNNKTEKKAAEPEKESPAPEPEHPEPVEYFLFVKGLQPDTTEDNLGMYMEARTQEHADVKQIIYTEDRRCAVVQLENKIDIASLQKRIEEKELEGCSGLEVCEVAPPTAIVVSSKAQVTSTDSMKYYFENKRNGGGELARDEVEETPDGCFIFFFIDSKAVKRICSKKTHVIDSIPRNVSPYYQCELGSMWDASLHQVNIPESVSVNIDSALTQFLQKSEKANADLNEQLSEKHAKWSCAGDKVLLECTLTPTTPKCRLLVKTWSTDSQDAFMKYRNQLKRESFKVDKKEMDSMQLYLEDEAFDTAEVLICLSGDSHTLIIAGFVDKVDQVLQKLQNKLVEIKRTLRRTKQIERLKSRPKSRLLESLREFQRIQGEYEDLEIYFDESGQELTYEGDPEDIQSAHVKVLEEYSKIEKARFPHSHKYKYRDFLCQELIVTTIQDKLRKKNLIGEWEVTDFDIQVCALTEEDKAAVHDVITDCVTVTNHCLEDSAVYLLGDEKWVAFLTEYENKYQTKMCVDFSRADTIVRIISTSDIHKEVLKGVRKFFAENTIKTDTVPCTDIQKEFITCLWGSEKFEEIHKMFSQYSVQVWTGGRGDHIDVQGTEEGIGLVKQELQNRLENITSTTHTIQKVDIYRVFKAEKKKGTIENIEKETSCLVKSQSDDASDEVAQEAYEEFEDSLTASTDFEEVVGATGRSPTTNVQSGYTTANGIRICLVEGELGDQEGSVIVCSVAPTLNLRSGASCKSLLKYGGKSLQAECLEKYPDGVKHGEIAEITGGTLECQVVYLGALPEWRQEAGAGGSALGKFVTACLEQASSQHKRSIIFPAMGTGQLKYPREVVASEMYTCVVNFDSKNPQTTLKDVKFVLYSRDRETVNAFRDEEKSWQTGGASASIPPPTTISTGFMAGKVQINLVTESIANQRVDGILCTMSTDFVLTKSGACAALVKAGGAEPLQAEWKEKYPDGIQAGEVGEISAGNLQCKTLYLTILPPHSPQGEQNLWDAIKKCLTSANQKGYTCLAIPALGTGYLHYPKGTVAKLMYDCVIQWEKATTNTSLKKVKFVMHPKDFDTQQAFRRHLHKDRKGRASRNAREMKFHAVQNKNKDIKLHETGFKLCDINFTVTSGDILEESTDVIVNSTGPDFQFIGAVANSMKKKCGDGLEQEAKKKKNKLQRKELASTGPHGLQCRKIYHIKFQERLPGWRKRMLACLEKANKKRFRSIAFPVLGSGSGYQSFQAEKIAEILCDALIEFFHSNKQPNLKEVKLVIFHKQKEMMYPPILNAVRTKMSTADLTKPRWYQVAKQKIKDSFEYFGPASGTQMPPDPTYPDNFATLKQQGSTITVQIYSDSRDNVKKCMEKLDEMVKSEYTQKDVEDEDLKELSAAEIAKICDVKEMVDITGEGSQGVIRLSGPTKLVLRAQDVIHQNLRNVIKMKNEEKDADHLYKMVNWQYEEITAEDIKQVPYEKLINLKIEKAYKNNKKHVELVDKSGKVYVVDFDDFVEYDKDDREDSVKVVRKDILKMASETLPSNWDPMQKDENIKLVTLANTIPEYQQVEKTFLTQVTTGSYSQRIQNPQNIKVTKIERVQNKALYQQYVAKKKQMEQKTPKPPDKFKIERQLWHGTDQQAMSSINMHGFNRSYCGKHGVWFGQGVYFAACASYSARAWMTQDKKVQQAGVKSYIYCAKVLTGEYLKGTDQMRYLPPKDHAKPLDLYDSAVDSVANPMEFVIFHDTQAYPEYLITFTF